MKKCDSIFSWLSGNLDLFLRKDFNSSFGTILSMPKRLREDRTIEIAPEIKGCIQDGRPVVYDEIGKRELNPIDIYDKITIYERQVKEWFLKPASRLLRNRNNGFIVLMTCLSYLEGVEQYRRGETSHNRSRQFFIEAVNRLYPAYTLMTI